MYHFCTITTADHMYKTMALYDSLLAIHAHTYLHVLCVDPLPIIQVSENMILYTIGDMAPLASADIIIAKYSGSKDKLRWSLKPVFLGYLIDNKSDKVIYVDNDLYFYGDYSFLFELLKEYNFLLTPHYYPYDPTKGQNWLEANFKVGLYNAGFVGVNRSAVSHLQWWAGCCAYRCEKNALRGTFDDQKYLDLIPVWDEKAHIIRHKGCNVAEWNKDTISRSQKDGILMLDKKYPLIFIHYNGTTVRAIADGDEPLLKENLSIYLKNLNQYNSSLSINDLYDHPTILGNLKYLIWKIVTRLGL